MFGAKPGLRLFMAAGLLAATSVAVVAQDETTAAPTEETSVEVSASVAEALKITVDVPVVNAVGASIDTDTIKAILGGDIAGHAAEIRHLSAQSITVPTLTVTYSGPFGEDGESETMTVVYNDLVISDVTDGTAAKVSIAGAKLQEPEGSLAYQGMSVAAVNFGAMLAFYGLVDADAGAEWQTLYRNLLMEGSAFDTEGGQCTFGKIEVARVEVRPLKTSILDMIEMLEESPPGEDGELDPEAAGELIGFVAEMATAIRTSPLISDGFDCSFTDEGETVEIGVGGLTFGGYNADAVAPEMAMNALDIAAADGSVSVGKVLLKSIDYSGPLAALGKIEDPTDDAWFEEHAREFVPAFRGVTLGDLLFDVPDPETPDERVKGSMKGFDLTLEGYRNAIPTSVASSLDNLVIEIPENSADSSAQELKAMGLANIDLSYDFKAFWDEGTETVNFDKLKVDAGALGTIGLSMLLGNATEELFSSDTDLALVAGMGITLKSLGLDIVDNGLGNIIYARSAADGGIQPEDVRTMFAGMAQGMVLGFLGANPAAPDLASAVGSLISASTPLSATISAKDPKGLSIEALQLLETNPTALGDMVIIRVK
jgi:hypothetical protein